MDAEQREANAVYLAMTTEDKRNDYRNLTSRVFMAVRAEGGEMLRTVRLVANEMGVPFFWHNGKLYLTRTGEQVDV